MLDLHPGIGDDVVVGAELGERACRRPRRDEAAAAHQLQRLLGLADRAHAVVDAPGAEAALRHLEAAALAQHQVVGRHAHAGEADVHVPVRRVVVAEDLHRAQDLDPGRVRVHEEHRVAGVLVGVGVGAGHDD